MTYTFKFLLQDNRYSEIYTGHLRLRAHLETQPTENLLKLSACVFIVATHLTTSPVNLMLIARHLHNISEQTVTDSLTALCNSCFLLLLNFSSHVNKIHQTAELLSAYYRLFC